MVKVDGLVRRVGRQTRRYDLPFKNERYFYGRQALWTWNLFWRLEATLYAIEQRDRWLVDSRGDWLRLPLRRLETSLHSATSTTTFAFSDSMQRSSQHFWTLLEQVRTIYGGRRPTAGRPYLSTLECSAQSALATLYDIAEVRRRIPANSCSSL